MKGLPSLFLSEVNPAIRKANKEKRSVLCLQYVDLWKVLLGIFEGTLVSYELKHFNQLASVSSTNSEPNIRGNCTFYSVHEKAGIVAVTCSGKKKIYIYSYNATQPMFIFRREISLIDVPKSILFLSVTSPSSAIAVVGYKKFYESVDLSEAASAANMATPSTARILDVEKEHRMAMLEVCSCYHTLSQCVPCPHIDGSAFPQLPGTPLRPPSLLLALGGQGVVLDAARVVAGNSFAFGTAASEERLEWIAPPWSVQLASPLYLASLILPSSSSSSHTTSTTSALGNGCFIEIHDVCKLQGLQKISVPWSHSAPQPPLLCPLTLTYPINATENNEGTGIAAADMGASHSSGLGLGLEQFILVSCGEQLQSLRMQPLAQQVEALVADALYEQALNLCVICKVHSSRGRTGPSSSTSGSFLVGVDTRRLHELLAQSLWRQGDFDRASTHFLKARTPLLRLLRLCPEVVPDSLSPLVEALAQSEGAAAVPPSLGSGPPAKPLVGVQLHRAASAIVTFCNARRPTVLRRVAVVEQIKRVGSMLAAGVAPPSQPFSGDEEEVPIALFYLHSLFIDAATLTLCRKGPPSRSPLQTMSCGMPSYLTLSSSRRY